MVIRGTTMLMSLRLLSWVMIDAVMKVTALGCAVYLYRFVKGTKHSPAIVSALIIGTTALITVLQFIFPQILNAFRRNPGALLAGNGGVWSRRFSFNRMV